MLCIRHLMPSFLPLEYILVPQWDKTNAHGTFLVMTSTVGALTYLGTPLTPLIQTFLE